MSVTEEGSSKIKEDSKEG